MIYRIVAEQVVEAPLETAYELVADVSRYPEFLSGLEAARADGDMVEMRTRVGPLVVSWTCTASYVPLESITTTLHKGPFRSLVGRWTFVPLNGKTKVSLELSLEPAVGPRFVERLLIKALEVQVEKSVRSFRKRVEQINGWHPVAEVLHPKLEGEIDGRLDRCG